MINVNGKYFRKFTPGEVFTNYIYELMKQGKEFMVFLDNKQVLIDNELEEFYRIHGFMSPIKYMTYRQYGNDGYIVRYNEAATNVFVPLDLLNMSYEDFIKQCEEDVNYRME